MIVREIEISEVGKLLTLIQQVDASSEYMLWEAGEREVGNEMLTMMIKRINKSNNSTVLVTEAASNELVGYLLAIGGNAKRNNHLTTVIVGIQEDYRGKGVGSKLFKELDRWAIYHHIHRIELTVVTKNKAGLSLYKKMGFEIEGTRRHSLYINDEFLDEYYMSKLINPAFD